MSLPRRLLGCVVVVAVSAVCAGGSGSSGEERGSPARGALVAQDTVPFVGSVEPVERISRVPPTRPAVLMGVNARREAGFDRVVFEFSGDSLPGYRIDYATEAIRACGSGDVVWPAAEGQLVVQFEPAQAHDSLGRVTTAERALAPGLPMVKELRLVCDFEGQIQWAVRLGGNRPYRVLEAAPARLTLDVRHRD